MEKRRRDTAIFRAAPTHRTPETGETKTYQFNFSLHSTVSKVMHFKRFINILTFAFDKLLYEKFNKNVCNILPVGTIYINIIAIEVISIH